MLQLLPFDFVNLASLLAAPFNRTSYNIFALSPRSGRLGMCTSYALSPSQHKFPLHLLLSSLP